MPQNFVEIKDTNGNKCFINTSKINYMIYKTKELIQIFFDNNFQITISEDEFLEKLNPKVIIDFG